MPEDLTQTETHPFTALGFSDIVLGSEIFDLLEVNEATFKDPNEFAKAREVASFFNKIPDAAFQVRRALAKKVNHTISNLDHIAGFVVLHKKLSDIKKQEEQLKAELAFYE